MSEYSSTPVSPATASENGSLLSIPTFSLDDERQGIEQSSIFDEHGINSDTSVKVEPIATTLGSTSNITFTARSMTQQDPQIVRRTFQEQLGTWNMFIVTIGSIYSLLILGFLWFLWFANESIPFWRWMVLKGYIQGTVTLCSAVLRTVVAIQSSLSTSMLAALIVETLGFRLRKSAFLSIQRSSGGLPFQLLELRYFRNHARGILCLTSSLCLTTVLAYFISFALITDFQLVSTPGYDVNGPVTYTVSNKSHLGDEPIYTNYRPASFPVFAEYSESAGNSNSRGSVDDTGSTVRAFLPITNPSTREQLYSFNGHGTLLNSHVVCLQPVIRNLTFESTTNDPNPRLRQKPILRGEIAIGRLPPGIVFNPSAIEFLRDIPFINATQSNTTRPNLVQSEGQETQGGRRPYNFVTFMCQMVPVPPANNDESPISMCVAGNGLDYNETYFDPGRLPILGTRSTSLLNESILLDPLSYVLVNYTGFPPVTTNLTAGGNIKIGDDQWNSTLDKTSIWTPFIAPRTYPTLNTVSLTYCFPHFAAIDMRVSVNGSSPRSEPVLTRNNDSLSLDASDVLRQLGADGVKRSLTERGVLTLHKSNDWARPSRAANLRGTTTFTVDYTTALDGSYGFGMQSNQFTPPLYQQSEMDEYRSAYQSNKTTKNNPIAGTWGLCTKCVTKMTDSETFGIHPALSSIFQGSLRSSGSLATALQALLTVVNTMQYYDRYEEPNQFRLVEVNA